MSTGLVALGRNLLDEVRGISLPRTRANKGKEKSRSWSEARGGSLKGTAPDRLEHRVQVRALDLSEVEGAGVGDLARLVSFHELA